MIEERVGKPGWVSTGPAGSVIEFDVRFGAAPRLAVVYERSYEGFGAALLQIVLRNTTSFTSGGLSVVLRGLRTDGGALWRSS